MPNIYKALYLIFSVTQKTLTVVILMVFNFHPLNIINYLKCIFPSFSFLLFLLLLLPFFEIENSLSNSGWLLTHKDPLASPSPVLGLQCIFYSFQGRRRSVLETGLRASHMVANTGTLASSPPFSCALLYDSVSPVAQHDLNCLSLSSG